MKKSILTVDISVSELDEFKQMIELNLELQNAIRGLIEAHTNGCGLGGVWDKEFKAAQKALVKTETWVKSLTPKKEK